MEYLTKREHTALKSQLTRAQNSGDPAKVVDAVEHALDVWDGKAWPDSWATWRIALDDVIWGASRTGDYALRSRAIHLSDRFF